MRNQDEDEDLTAETGEEEVSGIVSTPPGWIDTDDEPATPLEKEELETLEEDTGPKVGMIKLMKILETHKIGGKVIHIVEAADGKIYLYRKQPPPPPKSEEPPPGKKKEKKEPPPPELPPPPPGGRSGEPTPEDRELSLEELREMMRSLLAATKGRKLTKEESDQMRRIQGLLYAKQSELGGLP